MVHLVIRVVGSDKWVTVEDLSGPVIRFNGLVKAQPAEKPDNDENDEQSDNDDNDGQSDNDENDGQSDNDENGGESDNDDNDVVVDIHSTTSRPGRAVVYAGRHENDRSAKFLCENLQQPSILRIGDEDLRPRGENNPGLIECQCRRV
ncbi:hypothetical protein [Microvirga soli]|uniref:hypothetical protein n=1 Tax=Microvirga soli TaxID=1854496 RepID=UPI00191D9B3F|nr:hypothetical protein [Microvirga soli]